FSRQSQQSSCFRIQRASAEKNGHGGRGNGDSDSQDGHDEDEFDQGKAAANIQDPRSKIQRSSKFQAPIIRSMFGSWIFSGSWILDLGCSIVLISSDHHILPLVIERLSHLFCIVQFPITMSSPGGPNELRS